MGILGKTMGILGKMFDFTSTTRPDQVRGESGELDLFGFPRFQRFAIIGRSGASMRDIEGQLAALGGQIDVYPKPEAYLETVISVPAGHYHAIFIMKVDVIYEYFDASYLNQATYRLSPATRVFEVYTFLAEETFGDALRAGPFGMPVLPGSAGANTLRLVRRYAELSRTTFSDVSSWPVSRTNAAFAVAS